MASPSVIQQSHPSVLLYRLPDIHDKLSTQASYLLILETVVCCAAWQRRILTIYSSTILSRTDYDQLYVLNIIFLGFLGVSSTQQGGWTIILREKLCLFSSAELWIQQQFTTYRKKKWQNVQKWAQGCQAILQAITNTIRGRVCSTQKCRKPIKTVVIEIKAATSFYIRALTMCFLRVFVFWFCSDFTSILYYSL